MKKMNLVFSGCFILSLISLIFTFNPNESVSISKDIETGKEKGKQIAQSIFEIFQDKQGDLWFGTSGNGVAYYSNETLTYYAKNEGLCGNTITDIVQDKEGLIWFGSHSDMCLYNPKEPKSDNTVSFTYFERNGEVPHLGYGWKSVKTDSEGDIWVNTHHGIFEYENGIFKEFSVPTTAGNKPSFCSTPGGVSLDLIDTEGNMWFGTDGDGSYKFDGTSFVHFSKKDGLCSNSITGIEEDKNGNIWFSCIENLFSNDGDGGVCYYDGETFKNFKSKKGLSSNDIYTIYADNSNNIWIGATGFGVYKYDGNMFQFYNDPLGVDIADNVNISGLLSVLEDKSGKMWFGFSGGLYRLDDEKLVNITQDGPWK